MSIKNVLDNVNAIKDIAEATQNLNLKEKIVDLKEQVLELREENLELREKLNIQEKYNMIFENRVYWNEKDGKTDGPFCPVCWDKDQKAVRLGQKANYGMASSLGYHCYVCKDIIKIDK